LLLTHIGGDGLKNWKKFINGSGAHFKGERDTAGKLGFCPSTSFDQTGKCGKGKYANLLRLLFSFPAFSCLIERC
jgi:hypothetical protein